jgi:hypothetical protein
VEEEEDEELKGNIHVSKPIYLHLQKLMSGGSDAGSDEEEPLGNAGKAVDSP